MIDEFKTLDTCSYARGVVCRFKKPSAPKVKSPYLTKTGKASAEVAYSVAERMMQGEGLLGSYLQGQQDRDRDTAIEDSYAQAGGKGGGLMTLMQRSLSKGDSKVRNYMQEAFGRGEQTDKNNAKIEGRAQNYADVELGRDMMNTYLGNEQGVGLQLGQLNQQSELSAWQGQMQYGTQLGGIGYGLASAGVSGMAAYKYAQMNSGQQPPVPFDNAMARHP